MGVFRTSSTFQTDRNLPISIKRFTKFFIFLSAEKARFLPMTFTFAHTFYKKQKYEETFIPMEGRMFLIKKRVYDLPPFYRV